MKNRKIKIFFVITQAEFGGAQKYVYTLSIHLNKEKYNVTVICGENGTLIERLREQDIETIVLPELKRRINLIYDLKAFMKLVAIFRKLKPDIIHANSSKAGLLGRIAASCANVPIKIFTAHGFVFHEPMGKLLKAFYLNTERIAGVFSDYIIAVSRRDKESAIKQHIIHSSKIRIIHHGLDQIEFDKLSGNNNISRQDFGVPDSSVVIGTVANFCLTKGLEFFIRAACLIVKKRPDVKFIFVGDGMLRNRIKELIKNMELDFYFVLLGYREDVNRIFSIFDIYVLSSVKEGFPWVILEAMAAKKPIVATDVGGVPDMITHKKDGVLVQPGNPESLADGIMYLIDNPLIAKKMGESAMKKAENTFSLNKMISKTEDLYDKSFSRLSH